MDHTGLHNPTRYWAVGDNIEDHHVDPAKVEGRGWRYPVVGTVTAYVLVGTEGPPGIAQVDVYSAAVIIDGAPLQATIKSTGEVDIDERSGK